MHWDSPIQLVFCWNVMQTLGTNMKRRTKQIQGFPKFDGPQCSSWNWNLGEKKYEIKAETNPCQRFPKFDGLNQPPSTRFGRFQTLCEEKNTQKRIQKWIQMHGRANLSRNATFRHLSLIWGPLKIPHQGERGCGSRLSICWWLVMYLFDHPNREMAMLSTQQLFSPSSS